VPVPVLGSIDAVVAVASGGLCLLPRGRRNYYRWWLNWSGISQINAEAAPRKQQGSRGNNNKPVFQNEIFIFSSSVTSNLEMAILIVYARSVILQAFLSESSRIYRPT